MGLKSQARVPIQYFMSPTAAAPVVELAELRSKPKPRLAPKAKVKAKPKAAPAPKPKRPSLSVRESAARALRDLADRLDDQY